MNFLTVGFVLGLMQLDLGWLAGYVIKLLGALFILGGVTELGDFEKKARSLRPAGICFLVLSAGACAATFAVRGASDSAKSLCAAACGVVTTAAAVCFFKRLFKLLMGSMSLFRRGGLLEQEAKRYNVMLVLTALFLAADIINRFTGGTMAADAAGVLMFFSKIVFYIYYIMCSVGFGRLRADFNSIHSDGPSDNNDNI
ncbi:MAG: hypothetical protein IJ746_03135 [Ruminococcus sp.]|nr:hypothetical protein [Ruminococcus sp.]